MNVKTSSCYSTAATAEQSGGVAYLGVCRRDNKLQISKNPLSCCDFRRLRVGHKSEAPRLHVARFWSVAGFG